MAKFTSEQYPNLLVVGAGRFKDGELEATGDAAKKVRDVAKRFGIVEKRAPAPRSRKTASDD